MGNNQKQKVAVVEERATHNSIKGKMESFKKEMEEWKVRVEGKREEVQKMKRKKWNKDEEYQGEEKNGKRNGFGI